MTTSSIAAILVLVAALFWLASAFWMYKDARRRIDDPWLVGIATLLGLVPYLGPLVYMFFRPPEYLEDVRERELEIKAMEERLAQRRAALPRLPGGGRLELPRLPHLHHEAASGVHDVPGAARGAVAGLPVLRDPDRAEAPRPLGGVL